MLALIVTETVSPVFASTSSYVHTVRGRLSRRSASSSVTVSGFMLLNSDAIFGFGSAAFFLPVGALSCADSGATNATYGPNLPLRTSTVPPVAGSVPSTRGPPALLAMSLRASPTVSSSGAMVSGIEARFGLPSASRSFVSSKYGP